MRPTSGQPFAYKPSPKRGLGDQPVQPPPTDASDLSDSDESPRASVLHSRPVAPASDLQHRMNEKLTQLLNQENVDPTVANRASDELRALFEEQDARQRLAQNILNEGLRCAVRPPVHFQPSPDRLLPHSFWQTLFSQPGKTYVDTASGFEGCWEPESQHVRLSVHIDGRIEEAYIWLERSPVSNDGDVTHVVATAEAKRLLGRAGLAYLS